MRSQRGMLAGLAAYLIWGLLPIFWKALDSVPPMVILADRIVWSLVFLSLYLTLARAWGWLPRAARNPRSLAPLLLTAALIAVNWGTYIWANNNGHIVEESLGYFINPLVNVLLGVAFLRERPRRWQWAAVALAFVGVAYLTAIYGRLPWIALTLALTFSFYGLIRKVIGIDSVAGLTVEMAILFVPALIFLLVQGFHGAIPFEAGSGIALLLVLAGPVTAIPMVLFTYSARRIMLTTIGILQYISPTLQFLIGAYFYGEGFPRQQVPGFVLIWIALALYSVEGIVTYRRRATQAAAQARLAGS
jgi:chloramphenicol-sensitive protein RarD